MKSFSGDFLVVIKVEKEDWRKEEKVEKKERNRPVGRVARCSLASLIHLSAYSCLSVILEKLKKNSPEAEVSSWLFLLPYLIMSSLFHERFRGNDASDIRIIPWFKEK